jgi:hypothetical protein
MKSSLAVALMTSFLLMGCGGRNVTRAVYDVEKFKEDSPYKRDFSDSAQNVCECAQLALLSQGYRISGAEKESVTAQKDFQPDADANVVINLKIVCRGQASGSILFASALQTVYELKKNSQSTSLGISTLGSISVPLGSTSGELVKVGAETIADKDFYDRFFTLVESYLEQRETDTPPASPTP